MNAHDCNAVASSKSDARAQVSTRLDLADKFMMMHGWKWTGEKWTKERPTDADIPAPTPSPIGDSLLREAVAALDRYDQVEDGTLVRDVGGAWVNWHDIRDILAQHEQRSCETGPQSVDAPVPAGWVLVPREPTPEMLVAGFLSETNGFDIETPADAPGLVYRAMLAAAPTAPVSPALPYGWVEPETGNFAFHADVERCRKVRPNDYASWSVPVFAELRERNEGGGEAVAAWRGVNELGEVVTEWQDGAPPAILYDLCGNSPTYYASVQVAYTRPAPTASDAPSGYFRQQVMHELRKGPWLSKDDNIGVDVDAGVVDALWRIVAAERGMIAAGEARTPAQPSQSEGGLREALPNAESYVSVADADAYHVAFGNTAWAALITAAKEVALRKATAYMDSRYKLPIGAKPGLYGWASDHPEEGVVDLTNTEPTARDNRRIGSRTTLVGAIEDIDVNTLRHLQTKVELQMYSVLAKFADDPDPNRTAEMLHQELARVGVNIVLRALVAVGAVQRTETFDETVDATPVIDPALVGSLERVDQLVGGLLVQVVESTGTVRKGERYFIDYIDNEGALYLTRVIPHETERDLHAVKVSPRYVCVVIDVPQSLWGQSVAQHNAMVDFNAWRVLQGSAGIKSVDSSVENRRRARFEDSGIAGVDDEEGAGVRHTGSDNTRTAEASGDALAHNGGAAATDHASAGRAQGTSHAD